MCVLFRCFHISLEDGILTLSLSPIFASVQLKGVQLTQHTLWKWCAGVEGQIGEAKETGLGGEALEELVGVERGLRGPFAASLYSNCQRRFSLPPTVLLSWRKQQYDP